MKNRIAKSLIAVLILFAGVFASEAQTACGLSGKSAPLLLNLQTGMSPEQARGVFGTALKIKIKKRGTRTFFQNYIKKSAPESLRGVRALYLRFYDLKLYQIEIFYESRTDLPNLEAIKNALSAPLDLPDFWQTKNQRVRIDCGAISLVADNVLNPRVELTDEMVRAEIEARREKDKR